MHREMRFPQSTMTLSNGNISALLALCVGNLSVTGEFRSQRPLARSFESFSELRLNKRLCKQSRGWWFETISRPSWRHCNVSRKCFVYLMSQSVDSFSASSELKCLYFDNSETFWIRLDLFNDDTCPSGHISRRTQVNVSQSCFNFLNKLHKLNYIVQVWTLVEVNCVISDYKNPLHLDVVDRYLRRMGDKTIPDEAPPSLESFYHPWVAGIDLPQSRCCGFFVSFTNKHK